MLKVALRRETAVPPVAPGDAELVKLAREGDRQAFEQLVDRYRNLVFSVSFSLTGSANEAEEIAQETFVTAWCKLSEIHRPERFRSWICGIGRILSLRLQRRLNEREQGLLPALGAALGGSVEVPSVEPSPLDQVILREEEHFVRRALAAVPETYRIPLILFYQEQQSAEAVAETLDLSVENVRLRLFRGRKLIQQHMLGILESALISGRLRKTFTAAVMAALLVGGTRAEGALPAKKRHASPVARTLLATSVLGTVLTVVVAGAPPMSRFGPIAEAVASGPSRGYGRSLPALSARLSGAGADEVRGEGRSVFRDQVGATIVSFDFEDGIMPDGFLSGHLAPGPHRPGNKYAAVATLVPWWTEPAVAVSVHIDDLYYRATLVVRFDYWMGADAGDAVKFCVYDNDRLLNYCRQLGVVTHESWTSAEVPLRTLTRLPVADVTMQPGDNLAGFSILVGRAGGKPFFADNLLLTDDVGDQPTRME